MPRRNNRVKEHLLIDSATFGMRFHPDQAILMSIRATQRLRKEIQTPRDKESSIKSSKESLR